MSENIKDLFEKYEQNRLLREAHLDGESAFSDRLTTCSIRLSPVIVAAFDTMADHHQMSRQAIMAQVLRAGLKDVVEGTFRPYTNSEECIASFWQEARRNAGVEDDE